MAKGKNVDSPAKTEATTEKVTKTVEKKDLAAKAMKAMEDAGITREQMKSIKGPLYNLMK